MAPKMTLHCAKSRLGEVWSAAADMFNANCLAGGPAVEENGDSRRGPGADDENFKPGALRQLAGVIVQGRYRGRSRVSATTGAHPPPIVHAQGIIERPTTPCTIDAITIAIRFLGSLVMSDQDRKFYVRVVENQISRAKRGSGCQDREKKG